MASLVNYLVAALPGAPARRGIRHRRHLRPRRVLSHAPVFRAGDPACERRAAGRPGRRFHIHMAHCGSATRKLILALVAKALGVRTVMHVHGSGFDIYCRALPEWRRRALVAILRHCERVVVIGGSWRRFVVGEMGLDPVRDSADSQRRTASRRTEAHRDRSPSEASDAGRNRAPQGHARADRGPGDAGAAPACLDRNARRQRTGRIVSGRSGQASGWPIASRCLAGSRRNRSRRCWPTLMFSYCRRVGKACLWRSWRRWEAARR